MTALHILCSHPLVTGAYLNLAPEAVNKQHLNQMTPFKHVWKSGVTFLDDSSISSWCHVRMVACVCTRYALNNILLLYNFHEASY